MEDRPPVPLKFQPGWALITFLLVGSAGLVWMLAQRQNADGTNQQSADTSPRYNEVVWLCTHNAYNATESGFRLTNQNHGIKRQLNDGVGALMLDVWPSERGILLRHGEVAGQILGESFLESELMVIKHHLETNPDAIITLIFESYVPATEVVALFDKLDLSKYCYARDTEEAWPTLNEMRNNNQRLVVFTDRADEAADWYMPVWEHCFETHWDSPRPEMLLDNQSGRGSPENSLFIVNHFSGSLLNRQQVSIQVNGQEFLETRFGSNGKLTASPNFIVVDFYELGDVMEFVQQINENSNSISD